MLDEKGLRRADFDEAHSAPTVLADGQVWWLRKPRVRFIPDDSDVGFRVHLAMGDDYAALVEASIRAEGGVALLRAELAVARRLLTANYDLTTAQLGELLQFAYDADEDPEGTALRMAVLEVARGNGPKRSADTDG